MSGMGVRNVGKFRGFDGTAGRRVVGWSQNQLSSAFLNVFTTRRPSDPPIQRTADPPTQRPSDPATRRSADPPIRRSADPPIRR
jgi:hypothetical protein